MNINIKFKEGILKVYKNEYNLKYYSFKTKDFKEFCLNKIRKNNFYFLDKKTHLILKKHLGKKYRIWSNSPDDITLN